MCLNDLGINVISPGFAQLTANKAIDEVFPMPGNAANSIRILNSPFEFSVFEITEKYRILEIIYHLAHCYHYFIAKRLRR